MLPLAIAAGKLTAFLARASGRGGGTSLPGRVALRLCPDIATRLAARIPSGVVLVTGTNGKTTTSKLLAGVLRASGLRLVRNVSGANLAQGIASTLLLASDLRGRIRADLALLEVDEGAAPSQIAALSPRLILITNLFRDQLDRYGELATTARRLAEAIATRLGPESTVVANADDPLVWWVAERFGGRCRAFGLGASERSLTAADHASDSGDCEECGTPLDYAERFGSHMGRWSCPGCGRARPEPHVEVRESRLTEDLREQVVLRWGGSEETPLTFPLPGLHNVANAAACACAAEALGVSRETVLSALAAASPAFGRLEPVEFTGGRTAHLMLVKNPAGLNETARLIRQVGVTRPAMLALNDLTADGHDVSWIWDADLEQLAGRVDPVVASGLRARDMALRLKYAGFDPERILVEPDPRVALDRALSFAPEGGHIYALPTYTAMLELRGRLEAEGRVGRFWEEI